MAIPEMKTWFEGTLALRSSIGSLDNGIKSLNEEMKGLTLAQSALSVPQTGTSSSWGVSAAPQTGMASSWGMAGATASHKNIGMNSFEVDTHTLGQQESVLRKRSRPEITDNGPKGSVDGLNDVWLSKVITNVHPREVAKCFVQAVGLREFDIKSVMPVNSRPGRISICFKDANMAKLFMLGVCVSDNIEVWGMNIEWAPEKPLMSLRALRADSDEAANRMGYGNMSTGW